MTLCAILVTTAWQPIINMTDLLVQGVTSALPSPRAAARRTARGRSWVRAGSNLLLLRALDGPLLQPMTCSSAGSMGRAGSRSSGAAPVNLAFEEVELAK